MAMFMTNPILAAPEIEDNEQFLKLEKVQTW